jgi:hypothetical protein
MPPRWNENRLTEKLGIDYPIVQGPLGGLSSQRLTAAVSNFGGLGSFGAHGLSPGAIKDVIAEIRPLTSKPFAMNLWVSMEDEGARTSDKEAFNRSLAPLAAHIAGLGAPRPEYEPYSGMRFADQARVLLDERVPVFSFIYGIPPREILEECRARRIVTIGTATTPEESAALQDAGVDAIVASGFEAGGHRGSFLRAGDNSLTGTFSLVPQIADRVNVPVIAAGGIANARGVVAALVLWRGGRANGNGISGVRGVRRQLSSSSSLAKERSRTHRADKGLHRETRAGNPQPFTGGVEPGGDGDTTLSVAAKTCPKPGDPGRGGGPFGSPASLGWAECQSFCLHRRVGLLDLIGREGF